jgi:L-ascorbate metabolism protein UlaG (beta-lactamase superfamily)
MNFTRRDTMRLGMAGLAATTFMPFTARAQGAGDKYPTDGGEIVVMPVGHATFVMQVPGLVIYNDPATDPATFQGMPPADLVLITHEHGDHFKPETLAAIVGANTRLVVNPGVFAKLSDDMKAKATELANGAGTDVGGLRIDAIPAYNTTEDRKKYHPQGRDNGYVLTVDGRRVYIAGDTEDIPEMRALTDIDIAFLPMNLPFTMTVDQASSAVAAFKPAVVYPYHYGESDVQKFAADVKAAAADTQVVLSKWY